MDNTEYTRHNTETNKIKTNTENKIGNNHEWKTLSTHDTTQRQRK